MLRAAELSSVSKCKILLEYLSRSETKSLFSLVSPEFLVQNFLGFPIVYKIFEDYLESCERSELVNYLAETIFHPLRIHITNQALQMVSRIGLICESILLKLQHSIPASITK